MTKKRLKRMRSLISEARHLQEMLDQPAKTTEYVGDTAKDYRTGKPHSITITGYGQQDYPELKERYYQKLRDIQQEIAFLESFLDQITDPQTRDIIRLYYVNGLTQEQIAEELGFCDIHYFSRRFKMYYGCPPNALRAKKHREGAGET